MPSMVSSTNLYQGRIELLGAAEGKAPQPTLNAIAELSTILLTPVQVAGRLALSRAKVYELLQTEKLPSIKIGASRRVKLSDLASFIDGL
jgi:excisionase family DNA binding protein